MPNSILGNNVSQSTSQGQSIPINPQMIQQIKQFSKTVKGDPKKAVMNMVAQGMRSNQQLQQAMQMAHQIENMFK